MKIDHDAKTITVRQSWLDTAMRCPEEGRLAVVRPEFEAYDTDEDLIGTFAHYGIEQVIRGLHAASISDAIRAYASAYQGVVRFTKRKGMDEVVDMAVRCAEAWVREIYPVAPTNGAHSEVTFSVPIFEHRGYAVVLNGTVDLVPTIPELWDWKTTGDERRYDPAKKQKWAIQPTIYGMAAVTGLLPHAEGFEWPVTFRYGVMVKRAKQCKTLITTVQRDASHAAFAEYRIKTLIDLGLDFGFDRPWPQIDEDNFLCNETWCAFWSICKGAFISHRDNKPPSQVVEIQPRA